MHIMEENGSSALGLIQLPGAHSVRPPSMSPAPTNSVNPMQAPVQGGNSAVEHEPRSGRGGRIMYIECKAGQLTGPGRIGRVTFSKTGRTLYYRGKRFQSVKGLGSNPITTMWIPGKTIGFPDRSGRAEMLCT